MKNGKLFSKISFLDILVVVVLILLVVAVVVRLQFFSTPEEAEEKTQTVETVKENFIVTLKFQRVRSKIYGEIFREGDLIVQGGKDFGTVISSESGPYEELINLPDGTTVTGNHQDEYTYTVKVNATLQKKDGMWYTLSGKPIANGPTYPFGNTYFYLKGTVIGVEKSQ